MDSEPLDGSTGARRPGGTAITPAVVSVIPYALWMYLPNPASNFSTVAGGMGAPPE